MTFDRKAYMKTCSICGGRFYAKGLCRLHYYHLPEVKAKRKAYNKAYFQRPEVKAKIKAYEQLPKVKAKRKDRNQSSKNTTRFCSLKSQPSSRCAGWRHWQIILDGT